MLPRDKVQSSLEEARQQLWEFKIDEKQIYQEVTEEKQSQIAQLDDNESQKVVRLGTLEQEIKTETEARIEKKKREHDILQGYVDTLSNVLTGKISSENIQKMANNARKTKDLLTSPKLQGSYYALSYVITGSRMYPQMAHVESEVTEEKVVEKKSGKMPKSMEYV